jgi:hypothetical protein
MQPSTPDNPTSAPPVSPLDGPGAGDHDEPYRFGRRPRACAPFPFTERQYARLLVLRGRVGDRRVAGARPELNLIAGTGPEVRVGNGDRPELRVIHGSPRPAAA